MTINDINEVSPRKPLRLWPGVALVLLGILVLITAPLINPDWSIFGLLATVACGALILVWWLLFSRAPWSERLGAIVLMIVGVLVTFRFVDQSISGAGQGRLFFVIAVPTVSFVLVAWAAATRHLGDSRRRAAMVVVILLACVPWTLLRTAGVRGSSVLDLHWRWTPTPEERLLALAKDEPEAVAPPTPPVEIPTPAPADTPKEPAAAKEADAPAALPKAAATAKTESAAPVATTETPAEWPGFRGPERDGVIRGVRINTDWSTSPPVEIWRRPIGPGWSSFAVRGDLLYTQEQRGDDEIVASYKVSTGEPVWRHRDAVRFWESNGGPGPRATPTLSNGRVYAFGATGILNALDARSGKVVWSRNAPSDTGRRTPDWGFASSPLIVDDVVIVAVSGTLAGYDAATGKLRWVGPQHGGSYSSPQRTTIDGVPQIVLLSGFGATSVAPQTGALLWEHEWPGSAIVQPALTANGDIVINTIASTGGLGTRRLAVAHASNGWNVEERWTSNGLKPYFNDFVIHNGHAYGFDGSILACIDLEDGKRKWKGGRYGNGQLVLLPEQDLLLVMSEEGELALVGATTDQFKELARFQVLEGKTWNHPVLVRDVLLVRNGEEMAAFRLSLTNR